MYTRDKIAYRALTDSRRYSHDRWRFYLELKLLHFPINSAIS